jgi:hypothetical protein
MEKNKKVYDSKKIYGKKYNQSNINIQLDRNLVNRLRDKIGPQTLKNFLESYINEILK